MGYIQLKPNNSSHWLFVATVKKEEKKEKEEKAKDEEEKAVVGQRWAHVLWNFVLYFMFVFNHKYTLTNVINGSFCSKQEMTVISR